jgi:hypothetical protein
MELIVSSETSANKTQTPGIYPKENILHLEHGENLKSRICYESTNYVTGFIYGDPYFAFSDIISYFVDCILVARSKIVLSQRGFGGNGMICVFFQQLSKTGGLYFM